MVYVVHINLLLWDTIEEDIFFCRYIVWCIYTETWCSNAIGEDIFFVNIIIPSRHRDIMTIYGEIYFL